MNTKGWSKEDKELYAKLGLCKMKGVDVLETAISLDLTNPKVKALTKKVVFIDIETTLVEAYVFSQGVAKIGYNQIKEGSETKLATVSYASMYTLLTKGRKGVKTVKSKFKKDGTINDSLVVAKVWKVMDSHSHMVAHNVKFDYGKMMGRFVLHGMRYPSAIKRIDTMRMFNRASMLFKKLDYLCRMLLGSKKISTDFQLWVGLNNGNKECLEEMARYNEDDVIATLFPLYMATAGYNPDECIDFSSTNTRAACKVDGSSLALTGIWTNSATAIDYELYTNLKTGQQYRNKYCTTSKKQHLHILRSVL